MLESRVRAALVKSSRRCAKLAPSLCTLPQPAWPPTLMLSRSIWPFSGPHTGLWNRHSPVWANGSRRESLRAMLLVAGATRRPSASCSKCRLKPNNHRLRLLLEANWQAVGLDPPVTTRRLECAPCGVATHCMAAAGRHWDSATGKKPPAVLTTGLTTPLCCRHSINPTGPRARQHSSRRKRPRPCCRY